MAVNFIYMTAGSKTEAQKIGKALVESRLAACVNILDNMQSIYRWEEKVQEDAEVVLIAKTTESLVAELIDKVKSLHSYDCPCIVSVAIDGGHPDFLAWIGAEVRDGVTLPACWAFAGPMSREEAIAHVRGELGYSRERAAAGGDGRLDPAPGRARPQAQPLPA